MKQQREWAGVRKSNSKDRIATRRDEKEGRKKDGRTTARAERAIVVDERGVGRSGNETSSLC